MNQNRPLSRRAMLSLRRIKSFVFAWLRSPQMRIQCEASLAKTKLFILRRLNMALHDKGLCCITDHSKV